MVSHPGGTHLPSEPLFSVLWPIQTKFFSPLSFLPVLPCTQARSWAFMSKDVMHGMVIWPFFSPLSFLPVLPCTQAR